MCYKYYTYINYWKMFYSDFYGHKKNIFGVPIYINISSVLIVLQLIYNFYHI